MTGVFLYPQVGFRDFEVQAKESPSGDFSQVLDKAIGGIEFSDLARARMKEKGLTLGGPLLQSMVQACDQASQEGVENAVMITDTHTLFVHAPTRLVMDIVDKKGVFSGIDGAIVLS